MGSPRRGGVVSRDAHVLSISIVIAERRVAAKDTSPPGLYTCRSPPPCFLSFPEPLLWIITPSRPRPTACTTPATSTTPVASRSSRGSTTVRARRRDRGADRARQPRAPRRRGRRHRDRRRRRHPGPDARRVLPRGRATSSCRPPGRYGVGVCFLPQDAAPRASSSELLELNVAHRGPARPRLARRADRRGARRRDGRRSSRRSSASCSSAPARASPTTRTRSSASSTSSAASSSSPRAPTSTSPSFSLADDRLQGHADQPPARRLLPRPRRRALRRRALALVHSRFSTNTFPSWELAHPYRMIAHNGEINTLMGNVNWMRARESQLASELFGDDLQKVMPIVRPGGSDSATFDNVLELLDARRPLAAARGDDDDPRGLRRTATTCPTTCKGFYAYHSCLMEPWDGPAAVCFTDGRVVGATLDRNGLRPGRWCVTTRRLRGARLRGRRARHPARGRHAQGPPAARQAVPRRPRAGPDRRRRGGQARGRHPAAVRRVVRRATSSTSTTCRRT